MTAAGISEMHTPDRGDKRESYAVFPAFVKEIGAGVAVYRARLPGGRFQHRGAGIRPRALTPDRASARPARTGRGAGPRIRRDRAPRCYAPNSRRCPAARVLEFASGQRSGHTEEG